MLGLCASNNRFVPGTIGSHIFVTLFYYNDWVMFFKPKIILNNIQEFMSYLIVNTVPLKYNAHPVDACVRDARNFSAPKSSTQNDVALKNIESCFLEMDGTHS
jgi:hypothetical protein